MTDAEIDSTSAPSKKVKTDFLDVMDNSAQAASDRPKQNKSFSGKGDLSGNTWDVAPGLNKSESLNTSGLAGFANGNNGSGKGHMSKFQNIHLNKNYNIKPCGS